MENASKALLIAAAVLIVILLIAFGMKIFNSTSDVSGQATSTGQALSNQTNTAATSASDALSGLSSWTGAYSIKEYNENVNKYIEEFNSKTDDKAYEIFKENIQKESSKFGVTVKFGDYHDWHKITEKNLIRNEQGVIIEVKPTSSSRY